MPDPKESQSHKSTSKEGSFDLNSLSSISLGPDWGSGNKPKANLPRERKGDRGSPRQGGAPRRDRGKGNGGNRPQRRDQKPFVQFQPSLIADFYPEEEPFKILANAIKSSYRTFELFEIAQLILQKPERWVSVAKDPKHKEGEAATLFASVPDGLPFFSEQDALNHVFKYYLDQFFETETVEVEAPSGTFQMIHKCGFTGELLGPPNYHRYKAICQQHHAMKLSHLPFSKFEEKLEAVKDEEVIKEWVESMKTSTKYISKSDSEDTFNTLEDARLYLLTKSKDILIRPALSARFSGKHLLLLDPNDPVRKSIEYLHEGQVRFPLDTANHLRGRLRRMGFAVYKKGSKGVSFVCAVKRRFRKPDEVLADNLQGLIDFIEAHPNFPAKNLPREFLGIQQTSEEVTEGSEPVTENSQDEKSDAEATASPSEALAEAEAKAENSKEKRAKLSESELTSLKDLKRDLKYLVSEGYVIEYSDGRLFVPAIREEEINRLAKEKAEKEAETKSSESKESKEKVEEKRKEKSVGDKQVKDGSIAKESTESSSEEDVKI